jgi:hypothetical protein
VPAGTFHYLAPSVSSSLYRNGEVLTRRDRDGSDAGYETVTLETCEMDVVDARRLSTAERRTVDGHGFELLAAPLEIPDLDFFNQDQVVTAYYDQCARIVQDSTGATQVFAFDHNVRSAAGKSSAKRIAGGQQVQGPAHVVHGDYTLTSAPQRLRDLAKPPTGNDTLRLVLGEGRALLEPDVVEQALGSDDRFAIINVWRNIAHEPVATHPMALCDARSVAPQDLVVFEIHYHDRIGENYFAKHAPEHRWFFYPDMTRDEALLIKQWDSAGPFARGAGTQGDASDADAACTFSFHSAFEDPTTPPDAAERWSIEVRCIALYL